MATDRLFSTIVFGFLLAALHQIRSEEEYQRIAVSYHNEYREQHHVPLLEGDPELHDAAVKCAEYYLKIYNVDHSCPYKKTAKYGYVGENIFAVGGWNDPYTFVAKVAIQQWYKEASKARYNYTDQRNAMRAGHFTQVVWKGSKKMGFGVAQRKKRTDGLCAVALYYPTGNVEGMFHPNVLPTNTTR